MHLAVGRGQADEIGAFRDEAFQLDALQLVVAVFARAVEGNFENRNMVPRGRRQGGNGAGRAVVGKVEIVIAARQVDHVGGGSPGRIVGGRVVRGVTGGQFLAGGVRERAEGAAILGAQLPRTQVKEAKISRAAHVADGGKTRRRKEAQVPGRRARRDGVAEARVVVQVGHDHEGIVPQEIGTGGQFVRKLQGTAPADRDPPGTMVVRQEDSDHRHLKKPEREARETPERTGVPYFGGGLGAVHGRSGRCDDKELSPSRHRTTLNFRFFLIGGNHQKSADKPRLDHRCNWGYSQSSKPLSQRKDGQRKCTRPFSSS